MSEDLEGLNELSKKLSTLGTKVGSKFLRSAAMSATLPVVKAAKANVPKSSEPHWLSFGKKSSKKNQKRVVSPGFASRSVARKSRLSKDKRTATVMIGVKPDAYYAVSFLELGTKYVAKKPWLTKALEQNQAAVIKRLGVILKKKIEKEAKK